MTCVCCMRKQEPSLCEQHVFHFVSVINLFLINPPSGNVRIRKLIANIFECFEKRKGEDGKVNTQGLLSP